jgi:hypothetical protein
LGAQKNTITINGRIYDTKSGKLISTASMSQQTSYLPKQAAPSVTAKPKNVDGVVRIGNASNLTKPRIAKKSSTAATSRTKRTVRSTPTQATILHQKAERPKTLMRRVVKKPLPLKASNTARAVSGLVDQPAHHIVQSGLVSIKSRSTTIPRSKTIHHFNSYAPSIVSKKTEHIPVKTAPLRNVESVIKSPRSLAPPLTIKGPTSRPLTAHSIIEEGLRNATSHKRQKHAIHRFKNHGIKFSASLAIVFLLGGFFAYNNVPRISVKLAASKAGFSASIPSYKPVGYTIDKSIQYQTGKVVINYGSNIDNKTYSLVQEKTDLDSASMISSYLGSNSQKYSVNTVRGRSIYIYDDYNAMWVDGGVWYDLKGNAQLTYDQLLKIASSL